jgi:hypothetical protein
MDKLQLTIGELVDLTQAFEKYVKKIEKIGSSMVGGAQSWYGGRTTTTITTSSDPIFIPYQVTKEVEKPVTVIEKVATIAPVIEQKVSKPPEVKA